MLLASSMEIVGQAATPRGSIAGILATNPDVVVLDISLEGGTGLEVLRHLRPLLPGTAFIVLTNNSMPAYRKRYLSEGAAGFLDRTAEFDQLVSVIESASAR